MELHEINKKLNNFFVERDFDHTIIGSNLYLIIILMEEYIKLSDDMFRGKRIEINPNAMTRVSVLETIALVKKFYQELQIPFDIEKYITNGEIGFDDTFAVREGHHESYPHNTVNTTHQGRITDALVLVHELSHHRDMGKQNTYARELLTESLATTDELIFAKYLEENGYREESISYQKYLYYCFYHMFQNFCPLLKAIYLFGQLGSIAKENYKTIFQTETGYEEMIATLENIEDLSKERVSLYGGYGIAVYLGTYLSASYEETKDYSVLERLHQMEKELNIDIAQCLDAMGLDDINPFELIQYIKKQKERLIENKTSAKYFR